MARLPIHKIPFLAFERIIQFCDPKERILLSFCSKKTKRLIKNLRIRVPLVYVTAHQILKKCSHNIPKIRICSADRLELEMSSLRKYFESRRGIDKKKRRLMLEFKSFDDKVIRLWTIKSERRRIFVESCLSMKQCIMALLGIIFELFIPNKISWWQIAKHEDKRTIRKLCELVHLPQFAAPVIGVGNNILLDADNKFQVLLNHIGSVDRIQLDSMFPHAHHHVPRPGSLRHRPDFRNVFNFKHVEYNEARWVKTRHLTTPMTGCETISLGKTDLLSNDINIFLKSWLAGGKENLRSFEFHLIHMRTLEEKCAFSDIPVLKVVKDGRSTYYIVSKPEVRRVFNLAIVKCGSLPDQYAVTFTSSEQQEHAEIIHLVRTFNNHSSLKKQLKSIDEQIENMRNAIENATKGSDWEGRLTRTMNQLQPKREEFRTEFKNYSQQLERLSIRVVDGIATLQQ